MMKAIAPLIAIPLIGVVVTVGIILMLILPALFLRLHLIQVVAYIYEYDNSQLYLLVLLSKTHNGKPIYIQIADNLQTGSPDISFVKSELERIVGDRCFKLSTPTKIIAQSDCAPSKYTVKTEIVLPYKPNSLVETLTLVID